MCLLLCVFYFVFCLCLQDDNQILPNKRNLNVSSWQKQDFPAPMPRCKILKLGFRHRVYGVKADPLEHRAN